ncbi:MAG TPA: DNA gyrase inhibitor YacG [Stellaceae bacterium]|nr:DNA gyrase inhibitor YacG [Stellaceae bacterium]
MDDASPKPGARPCPICGKPADAKFRPFCSARCRTIDLGRWIDGRYRIPSEDGPEDEAPEEA